MTDLANRRLHAGRGARPGPTGVVWRATAADGSVVAVKLLDPALAGDEEYRARFAREARSGGAGDPDAHLVQILEASADEETVSRAGVRRRRLPGGEVAQGPLGLERTLSVIADVGAGLDALHRGRIVHRDVKPSNVMLREDSSAALTDFGLAKGAAYTVLAARPGAGNAGPSRPSSSAVGRQRLRATSTRSAASRSSAWPGGRRSPTGACSAWGRRTSNEPPDPPTSPDVGWALLRALEKDPAARPATATMCANLLRVASRP